MTNKLNIAAAVAAEQNITKTQAKAIVTQVFDYVAAEVAAGNDVNVAPFGKFKAVDVPEKEHGIPGSTEKVTKPAHKVIRFKPSSALKSTVA